MDDTETAHDTAESPDEERIHGSTSRENKATAATKADAEEEPKEAEAVSEDDGRETTALSSEEALDTVADTAVVEPSERQNTEEHPAEKGAESAKSE